MRPHRKNDSAIKRSNADAGGGQNARSPQRQCALSRERLGQDRMVRFVRSPDGVVMPDIRGKLPGRGVWIKASRAAVDQAVKRGVFARSLKAECKRPEGLSDSVEQMLLADCLGVLGMARKAGQIICGFDQVRSELRKCRPGWLLEASDGAEDGREKVYFLGKALYEDVKVAGALSSAELGIAFGRTNVIHGLIREGAFADRWAEVYGRLAGFRQMPEASWFSRNRAG